MNILYISENFPPYDKGGAEISTSLIAKYTAKENNCYILTGKFQKTDWEYEGLKVFPRLWPVLSENNSLFESIRYGVKIVVRPIINIAILVAFIYKHKIDLVHFVPTEYYYAPLVLAAVITGKPFVVDVRNYALVCPSSLTSKNCQENNYVKHTKCMRSNYKTDNTILRLLTPIMADYEYVIFKIQTGIFRLVIKWGKNFKIVPNSQFVKNILVKNGYPKDKMQIIYNIISDNHKEKVNTPRKKQIVFAGQFDKSKGIWDLVNSFEKLDKPDYKLLLAGNGKEMSAISKYIIEKKLLNIKLLGYLPNNKVKDLYQESKIVAAPSVWPEPFGRFILESMSSNTPLVTTNVGGTPEGVENNITGIVVEPSNIDGLCRGLKKLIDNENLYINIVKNIEKEKIKYSFEKIGSERIGLYRQLMTTK